MRVYAILILEAKLLDVAVVVRDDDTLSDDGGCRNDDVDDGNCCLLRLGGPMLVSPLVKCRGTKPFD